MNRRLSISLFCSAISLCLQRPAFGQGQTNSLVVPRERADSWGRDIGRMFGGEQFQQIYSSAEFSDAPADVIALTGMAFRWDESFTGRVEALILTAEFKIGQTDSLSASFYKNLPNPITVVSTSDVSFVSTEARPPEEFDLVFPFRSPFVFDRRIAWLVLQGAVDGTPKDVDAEFGEGTRGFFHFIHFGQLVSSDAIFVTKFFYVIVPTITQTAELAGSLVIELTADQSLDWVIESTSDLNKPFMSDPNAILTKTSGFRLEATIPKSGPRRLYRFRSGTRE